MISKEGCCRPSQGLGNLLIPKSLKINLVNPSNPANPGLDFRGVFGLRSQSVWLIAEAHPQVEVG